MTDRARKAIGLARAQSQRLNHAYVGGKHLLLGIVQEGGGVAAAILRKLDIGTDDLLVGLMRESNGVAAKVLTKLEVELAWVRKAIAGSPRESRSR